MHLRWLWLSLAVIGLDQFTKQLVESVFSLYESVAVMPFINLTLVYNRGAAFSFLSDQGGWQRWFFVVLAIAVTIVLISWMRRLSRHERLVAIALSLIIGGAVGNLIDRIIYGHVIDFVDLYYGQYHWPAFNVADSAIVLGVALMLFDLIFGEREQSQ
jgi:signal peptidase II